MASRKDDLVAAMKGQRTTKGWDVVVSYSSAELNRLLQGLWKQSSTMQSVQFVREFFLFEQIVKYNLSLGSPSLEFPPGDGAVALLKMPISGDYQAFNVIMNEKGAAGSDGLVYKVDGNGKTKKTIPDKTYELWVTVPLVSVAGDSVDGNATTVSAYYFKQSTLLTSSPSLPM